MDSPTLQARIKAILDAGQRPFIVHTGEVAARIAELVEAEVKIQEQADAIVGAVARASMASAQDVHLGFSAICEAIRVDNSRQHEAALWREVRPLLASCALVAKLPGAAGQQLADWIDAHLSDLEAE